MALVSMINGYAVKTFDWKDHGNLPPIPQLWGAATRLDDMVAAALAKADELKSSKDFTEIGRKNALRAWVKASASPVVMEALTGLKAAETAVGSIRSGMTGPPIDKSDLAGAVRRSEIRTWLRGLDDGKKISMLTMVDQLEPEIASAITEAPAELSGVTREQRERLTGRAMAVRFPNEAANITKITAAAEALDDHVRMATETLVKIAGVTARELAGMAGEPSLSERIAAVVEVGEGAEMQGSH